MNSARDWLRNAKERFRAFAHAGEKARSERPRVGVALAGGFARGIAHIGVLRVLREAGIPIDCVAGTSVGALIGTAYCAGTPLEDMEAIGRATSFADFGRWTPSWLGLATNQRMEKYLERLTAAKTFEELKTPLAISTSDINEGITVYYTNGSLAQPLRASCAYPALFVPIQYDGRTLVDGFLTERPFGRAKRMAFLRKMCAKWVGDGGGEQADTLLDAFFEMYEVLEFRIAALPACNEIGGQLR